jgi:hypothetical protein
MIPRWFTIEYRDPEMFYTLRSFKLETLVLRDDFISEVHGV